MIVTFSSGCAPTLRLRAVKILADGNENFGRSTLTYVTQDDDYRATAPHDVQLADNLDHVSLNRVDGLVAVAAIAETGTMKGAADLLGKAPRTLQTYIDVLAKELGVTSLFENGAGNRLELSGRIAEQARDIGRMIVYHQGASRRLKDTNVRVRYLPQHGYFMAAVEAALENRLNLHPKTLSEEDRSVSKFRDEVIAAVAGGTIDLAIGLAPTKKVVRDNHLQPRYLYSSRQEAMVEESDPLEKITLAELVARGNLLVPPPNTRSRDTLDDAIRADVPNVGDLSRLVKREAFGTKVLIQYGMKRLGTVVVPSDIAHVFKCGNDYGGPSTSEFKWIPVVRLPPEDPPHEDLYIYQQVYATVRAAHDNRADAVQLIIDTIREKVDELGLETDPNKGQ